MGGYPLDNQGKRLNKFIADSGYCSRREADRLIDEGRIRIDGHIGTLGDKVLPGMTVTIDGQPLSGQGEKVYILLNKPVGVVCTTDPREPMNVVDYLNYPIRIFPVGRLDKDTEGLLLITNDGALAHHLLSPRHHVDKTYLVRAAGAVTDSDLRKLEAGVDIGEKAPTLPAKARLLSSDLCPVKGAEPAVSSLVELTIHEGKFHQVKRMFQAIGKPVTHLRRVSMGSLVLDEALAPGAFRPLTKDEISELHEL